MRWIVGWPGGDRPGGVHEPDGSLRDRRDDFGGEPDGLGRSPRAVDRLRASAARGDGAVLDINSSVSPTYGEQEGTACNATSSAPATIRCSCSIRTATWSDARCVRGTSTARTAGARCSIRCWRAIAAGLAGAHYVAMRPSRSRMCTSTWRRRVSSTRSACPRTRCSRAGSPTCSRARWADPRTTYGASTRAPLPGADWSHPRRREGGVAPGELLPRVGFVVTNPRRPAKKVVAFYNGRGTAEQCSKEGKNAVKWTRLSCRPPGQRGSSPASRAGLRPRQLPSHARPAGRGRAVVADEPAGEGGEDWREGDRTRPVRDLPDGGGGGAAGAVRRILDRIARLRPPAVARC